MSEVTKRGVCKVLGCDYDKCQWRDDGYGGGGYNGDGYSGVVYNGDGYNKVKEYKTVIVKEIVKEESIDEYNEEEDEYEEEKEVVVKPPFISNKVEGYQKPTATYNENECDDVSFFSALSLRSRQYAVTLVSHLLLQSTKIRTQKHFAAVKKQVHFKQRYQFATKCHVLGKSVDGARGMAGTMMVMNPLPLQLLGKMTVMISAMW